MDPGYAGTPDRWVAARGSIVQQGFLTNEPFAYENELPAWDKKVAWLLVADAGYPVYPETLTIRPDHEQANAACLKRLVPIIQRSAVGYLADPGATNALIVRLTRDYGAYPYSPQRAAYAATVMRDNGDRRERAGRDARQLRPGQGDPAARHRPAGVRPRRPAAAGRADRGRRGHQRLHRPQGGRRLLTPAVIWLSPPAVPEMFLSDPEFTL